MARMGGWPSPIIRDFFYFSFYARADQGRQIPEELESVIESKIISFFVICDETRDPPVDRNAAIQAEVRLPDVGKGRPYSRRKGTKLRPNYKN